MTVSGQKPLQDKANNNWKTQHLKHSNNFCVYYHKQQKTWEIRAKILAASIIILYQKQKLTIVYVIKQCFQNLLFPKYDLCEKVIRPRKFMSQGESLWTSPWSCCLLQSWNLIWGMPLMQIEMRFRFIIVLEWIVPNSDLVIFLLFNIFYKFFSKRFNCLQLWGFPDIVKKKKNYMFSVIQRKMSAWEEVGVAGYHT